ncbi:MAG: glycosyltransferase family 2 protein [Ignavibacterium sp.]|jgi:glycosyltransferase involved in cell wall biosynthesis|nr:glycosyltransferase family 2 protein [Ignavibacterium sp.]
MQAQNKISVVIITGNEENNIRDCLQSAVWADEIIVVDSESTDNTVEIAKEFTDKVFVQKWLGYSKQKSYAISLAKNEWVVSLDADERVTKPLADEILNYDLDNTKYSAFKMKRENYFIGKKISGCGWGNDYQLRLFRKSKTKLSERLVHEKFIVEGEVAELKNVILHYSYNNLKEGFDKINTYSSLEAEEKHRKKKVSTFRIIFFPVVAFLQHYLFRKGIKDGKHGLMVSLMHAITKLQVQMKIWEIKQN